MWTRSDWHQLTTAPRPSLKNFALFLILIFLGLNYYSTNPFFLIGAFLTLICYFLYPLALQVLNEIWFLIGVVAAWLIQPILLLLIYFLIFTPVGFLLKFFSRKKNTGHWIYKTKSCQFDKAF